MTLHFILALVDKTSHKIHPSDLSSLAGALNEQIGSDFGPAWKVSASVVATQTPGASQWQVQVLDKLDQPGALGYHTNDTHNQPVSYVQYGDDWQMTVSHETLEMLADPYGNRMHSARLPDGVLDYKRFGIEHVASHVHYLLEVCDPCEATNYNVGGENLSDFLLPDWYRTSPTFKEDYSHAGGCSRPRQVSTDGYVSFANNDGDWFQIFNENGLLKISDIGKFNRAAFGSLREFSDTYARAYKGL